MLSNLKIKSILYYPDSKICYSMFIFNCLFFFTVYHTKNSRKINNNDDTFYEFSLSRKYKFMVSLYCVQCSNWKLAWSNKQLNIIGNKFFTKSSRSERKNPRYWKNFRYGTISWFKKSKLLLLLFFVFVFVLSQVFFFFNSCYRYQHLLIITIGLWRIICNKLWT